MSPTMMILVAAILAVSFVVDGIVYGLVLRPLLRARKAGLTLSAAEIIALRRSHVPPMLLIEAWALLKAAGQPVALPVLEAAYQAHKHQVARPEDLARWVKH